MEDKILKAYNRLKEFELFSEDFATFKGFFYENLKAGKEDVAIELLLMVCFKLLKSDGEKFNLLLEKLDNQKRADTKTWLNEALKKVCK